MSVRTLYFLRHAKAQDRSELLADMDRSLTDKGRQQARQVGHWLARQQLLPDLILSSPYPRAWQTAALCQQAAECDCRCEQQAWLAHGTALSEQAAALAALLPTLPAHTLLVGHEPEFSLLLADLLAIAPKQLTVRKASLWCVEITATNQPTTGRLLWALPVQLMG